MSKKKKRSGKKVDRISTESIINLIAAILNLLATILVIIEIMPEKL